jgi:hypothetical protein
MTISVVFITFIVICTTPVFAKDLTRQQNNAKRSAKQYISFKGFSRDGLIQQLSSSAGDKYTESQAKYGAQKAGAYD